MAGLIITANGHRASAASAPFASTNCNYCSPATYSSTFMMTCLLIGVGFIIALRALCSCCCSLRRARISCPGLPAVVTQSTEVAFDLSLSRHRPWSSSYCCSTAPGLLLGLTCRRRLRCCCRSTAGSAEPASAPSVRGGFVHGFGSVRRSENWKWIASWVATVGSRRCCYC